MLRTLSAGAALFLFVGAAAAHYEGKPTSREVKKWFESQYNTCAQHKTWCCNVSDGHPYEGNYDLNPDGSVTLWLPKGPQTLPSCMVVKGPNRFRRPVWWYLEDYDGSNHRDYCFAPGAQG
jgi:hypothetical protein